MLNPVFDTVIDMPFQHDLTDFVQSGFGCIDLGENIFSGNIFINHTVNGLNLSDDFFQSAV